jgi:hypothetical protein
MATFLSFLREMEKSSEYNTVGKFSKKYDNIEVNVETDKNELTMTIHKDTNRKDVICSDTSCTVNERQVIFPDSIFEPVKYGKKLYYFGPEKIEKIDIESGDKIHATLAKMGYYRLL